MSVAIHYRLTFNISLQKNFKQIRQKQDTLLVTLTATQLIYPIMFGAVSVSGFETRQHALSLSLFLSSTGT